MGAVMKHAVVALDLVADFNPSKVAADRYALDSVVFEALELNQDDQMKIYELLIDLVSRRLTKSKS
jgi:hypothetical protein